MSVNRLEADSTPGGRSAPIKADFSANGNGARRGPRIALYSHDTQGLGHIRRNLLITAALCGGGTNPVILLLSGLREASAYAMPPGVDCLTLPSLGKGEDGMYFPRSLGVPMEDLMHVRSKAIAAALRSFDPDVLIVDKVPRGVFDELVPSLTAIHARGTTRVILGLREILDEPEAVAREWEEGGYASTIRAYYDGIWVYGDQNVYDTAKEYHFPPDLQATVQYTGYLNPRDLELNGHEPGSGHAPAPPRSTTVPGPRTICLVGGGRDGLPLAEAFLHARFPGSAVLVTGPLMPASARQALRTMAEDRPEIEVLEFVTDPCPLIEQADRVIAMGGYNTMCEILAYGKAALIVPRTVPRTEQLIRARRFAQRGLVDLLHPDDLSAEAIEQWLVSPNGRPVPQAANVIDFGGVQRLPSLLTELTAGRTLGKEPVHAAE